VFSVGSVLKFDKRIQAEDAKKYITVVGRELGRVLEMTVEVD
jgi:hypothetical protein